MEEKGIDIIIRKFYSVADLAHICHENTKSFAQHEAFGEFYGKVLEIKDRTIEYLIGIGKLQKVNAKILEIGDDCAMEATSLGIQFDSYANALGDNALINISGEYMEAVGKLKYKLMFM
jgi:hypothetical protein